MYRVACGAVLRNDTLFQCLIEKAVVPLDQMINRSLVARLMLRLLRLNVVREDVRLVSFCRRASPQTEVYETDSSQPVEVCQQDPLEYLQQHSNYNANVHSVTISRPYWVKNLVSLTLVRSSDG